jgi:hypothetical protein
MNLSLVNFKVRYSLCSYIISKSSELNKLYNKRNILYSKLKSKKYDKSANKKKSFNSNLKIKIKIIDNKIEKKFESLSIFC